MLVAVKGATIMTQLTDDDARKVRERQKERHAARGCHPDDGERENERWDFGL